MLNSGMFLAALYFCIWIGLGIYVLTLLSRFVRAHERMAAALERAAPNLHRENK
jgi:hypothetical protein